MSYEMVTCPSCDVSFTSRYDVVHSCPFCDYDWREDDPYEGLETYLDDEENGGC